MYTNQSRIEAYLKRSLTSAELINLDETIEYLSAFIENYTGRTWSPLSDDPSYETDDEPSVRVFDGNNGKELWIDDCKTISKIELLDSSGSVSSTYSLTTDFITYPLNKTIVESVVLRTTRFPKGRANVAITAIWGGGTVPSAIVMVCTALVADFLSDSGDEANDFVKESIEGYSYELAQGTDRTESQSKLMVTLDKYKKESL